MMIGKALVLGLLTLWALLFCEGCSTPPTGSTGSEETPELNDIEEIIRVQERHQDDLLKIQSVHTVMIGEDPTGQSCIVVKVEPGIPEQEREKIPNELDGFPVCIIEEPSAGIQ